MGTLKKCVRTGQIALVSFIRLVVTLKDDAALENLLLEREFETLDEVLESAKTSKRRRIKRGLHPARRSMFLFIGAPMIWSALFLRKSQSTFCMFQKINQLRSLLPHNASFTIIFNLFRV